MMIISNRYKDTLNDFIDSSDTEFSDWLESPNRPGPIDKGTHNALRSRSASPTLSEEDCLDEDILVTSLKLAPKTKNSQGYKYYDVTPLGFKSGRLQYGKGQRGREDRKDKRSGENEGSERGRGSHWQNKVNPMVREISGAEASAYHHIIDQC